VRTEVEVEVEVESEGAAEELLIEVMVVAGRGCGRKPSTKKA
jgi:hypothetical protein